MIRAASVSPAGSWSGDPADVFYSLMTPCEPELAGAGRLRLTYAPGKHAIVSFDAGRLDVRIEPVEMESRLRRNWGDRMFRVVLAEKERLNEGIRTMTVRLEE